MYPHNLFFPTMSFIIIAVIRIKKLTFRNVHRHHSSPMEYEILWKFNAGIQYKVIGLLHEVNVDY